MYILYCVVLQYSMYACAYKNALFYMFVRPARMSNNFEYMFA